MRYIVLIIVIVGATSGLARPYDHSQGEHSPTRHGAPTLAATAFLRKRTQQGRRPVRSTQQDEEIHEAFALYDVDGDGTISDKEFELYDSHDEYETADHDVDGDGTLDLQEFARWYDGPLEDEQMRDVFKVIDVDASGFVSASELLQGWSNRFKSKVA